ncbi:MAG: hypothetical protein ACTSV1_01600 [Alphaproteobacteria bacterium]
MTRFFLSYVLPLALPTLLYLIWATARRRRTDDAPPLGEGPWLALSIAGLALMLAALVATTIYGGMEPNGEYVAPYLKDGTIVPGHMEPKK